MGFLHPAMLWGALLIAVPIIIYLINRRRYQRRPWAAMEFLLKALKKHRRRLQIENLLLLFLRVAALLLLAVAISRPFLRTTPIGILSEKEENWILCLDTSYSMGFKDGPRSLFERARESVVGMVMDLIKPRDRVAIATLDAAPRMVVGPTPLTPANRADVLQEVGELRLGPGSVDLSKSLALVKELAARFETAGESGPAILPKKIILFSDFQRRDWLGDAGPRDPATLEIIREIQEAGGEIYLGNLGGSDRNLSLLDLSVTPEVIARDVWVELRAAVRNWSKEDFEAVELKFQIDGQEEAGMILRVPAGETVISPPLPYRFAESGYHSVTAEIRSDGLVADNRRFLALRVREEAAVLLVDGEPGAGPRDRETLYLLAALSPDSGEGVGGAEGRLAPYRPEVRTDDQLDQVDPRNYVLVVLANVGELPQRFARELEAYVQGGGALMVFLGKNVDSAYYNDALLRQGAGLVPMRLLETVKAEPRAVFHLVRGEPDHPLVTYFEERQDVTSILQAPPIVEFREFYRVDVPGPDGAVPPPPPQGGERGAEASPSGKSGGEDPEALPLPLPSGSAGLRVAFRFSDPQASPAVLDAGFGQGRSMWITTTADKEWTEFPTWPDFVAFLYRAIPYLVRFGEARINLAAGEPFRQIFEAAEYAQVVMLIPPDSTGSIAKAMTKMEGENRFFLTHEETEAPGIYELRLSRPGPPGTPSRDSRQVFAVNLDPREGDLRALSSGDLREHFPALKAQVFDAAQKLRELGRKETLARGTELWRLVLWAVFLVLLTETLLAQVFGRSQR